jgi:hypothetical protein
MKNILKIPLYIMAVPVMAIILLPMILKYGYTTGSWLAVAKCIDPILEL